MVLKSIFLIFILCLPLSAQATTLKIATLAPDGSSWMNTIRASADKIDQATEGRVQFKFYPGGVMGDDKAVLRKMRIGQLQGAVVASGSLSRFYPDSQVYNLILKFRSFDEVDYVRQHLDQTIIQGFADAGLVTFGLSEGGFAYAMSQQPVHGVEDLKPLKIWAPDYDAMSRIAMQAFGINPIPLPISDVLTGLQTGLIDSVAGTPVGTLALQWHTQLDYANNLPLLYIYGTLAINRKDFDRLSAEDQQAVSRYMTEAFNAIDRQTRKDNLAAFEALKTQGIEIISPTNEELAGWEAKAELANEKLISEGVVSQQMANHLDELLAQFRTRNSQL